MKSIISVILTFSSIALADGKLEKEFRTQMSGLNRLALEVAQSNLTAAPGPIVELLSQKDLAGLRYIDLKNGAYRLCSGQFAKQLKETTDLRYCTNDANRYYENLALKVSGAHRTEVAQQLATITTADSAKEIFKKISSDEADSTLNQMNLSLLSYNPQTTEATYLVSLSLTQPRPYFTSVKRQCKGIIYFKYANTTSESGRPISFPVIEVPSLLCAPGI